MRGLMEVGEHGSSPFKEKLVQLVLTLWISLFSPSFFLGKPETNALQIPPAPQHKLLNVRTCHAESSQHVQMRQFFLGFTLYTVFDRILKQFKLKKKKKDYFFLLL